MLPRKPAFPSLAPTIFDAATLMVPLFVDYDLGGIARGMPAAVPGR
jgi:hypothetical protein